MKRISPAKGAAILAIVIGFVAMALGVAWSTSRSTITPPAAAPASLPPSPTPTVPPTGGAGAPAANELKFAVLGDSLAQGAGTDGGPGWPDRLATDLCWSVAAVSAQGGTGYARVDEGAAPGSVVFSDRVKEIIDAKPQIVLVEGGENDVAATPQQIVDGAVGTFKALRDSLGQGVAIVAIGPAPAPKQDVESVARVSGAISYAASGFGVQFLDPLRAQWLPDPGYWSDDGYHPNESGYVEYVKRLSAELEKLGAKKCGS